MVPTWRPRPYLQPSAWSLGRSDSHNTSERSHPTTHTWDPPSWPRGQERPGLCLTYNREPGAFSKENLSVHTVKLSREESNLRRAERTGSGLVSGGPGARSPLLCFMDISRKNIFESRLLGPQNMGRVHPQGPEPLF